MRKKDSKIKLKSARERLELLLAGLSGKQDVKKLCRKAGISRELYYRWLKRVRKKSLQALRAGYPGPTEKENTSVDRVKKLVRKVTKLRRKLLESKKQEEHLQLVVKTARKIIKRQGWNQLLDSKKNDMQRKKQRKNTGKHGNHSAKITLPEKPLQNVSEFTEQRTGGGSTKDTTPAENVK